MHIMCRMFISVTFLSPNTLQTAVLVECVRYLLISASTGGQIHSIIEFMHGNVPHMHSVSIVQVS